MLRAAVIGVGSMGYNHVRVYRELQEEGMVQLVAVADQNASKSIKVGSRYNVPHFADYRQLIDECTPDLVSLAVPTSLHCAMAVELLERGVSVLVEKPIASTLEEGEKMIAAAQKSGATLAIGHVERFNPVVTELRRRLREGMAGRIYKILAERLSPYPARIYDVGVVIDLASHDIDLLRYLMNEDIIRLYGETTRTISSEREDAFTGMMRFRSGALGVLDVNWITPTKVRRITITGARGMFRCDLLSQELFFYENEIAPSQWDSLSVLRGVSEGNVLGVRIARQEPLMAELIDFISAVKQGRPPTVSGREGLDTLRIALEFMRSGQNAEIVTNGHLNP
jgi:UDP-N-acetylglucosamine 3-dehydrogenase